LISAPVNLNTVMLEALADHVAGVENDTHTDPFQ